MQEVVMALDMSAVNVLLVSESVDEDVVLQLEEKLWRADPNYKWLVRRPVKVYNYKILAG